MALSLLLNTALVLARFVGNDESAWDVGRFVRMHALWQGEVCRVLRGSPSVKSELVQSLAEEALGLEFLLRQLVRKADSPGQLRRLLRDQHQLRENLVLRSLTTAISFADSWHLERLQRRLETVLQDLETIPPDLAIGLIGLTILPVAEESGSSSPEELSLRERLIQQLCSAALESIPREQYSAWGGLMSPLMKRLCFSRPDRPLASASMPRL